MTYELYEKYKSEMMGKGVDLGNLGINKLGIVPACDLKQNTCAHIGEDGYYTIVGAKFL